MNLVFLPYEHDTFSMTQFAKSLANKIKCEQFFFISDFFSQISSNKYTNKYIEEHKFDKKNIFDIYDEIKEISLINENSKSINVDYKFLAKIENLFLDETVNSLIFKDFYFYNFYHPRDIYYIPKNKELTYKFVEIIIKKILKFLEFSKPNIVLSFGNNHLIRNIFYQLSVSYNYKFLNLTHTRLGNRYYFCEKNRTKLTDRILKRAKYLEENTTKINKEIIDNFLSPIEQRLKFNEGAYNIKNVYNPDEINLSTTKKILTSGFFKRSLYLLKDIYLSRKLSSHRGFFKPPYFGEKSYLNTYLKNYRNIFRVSSFNKSKNLIYKGNFNFNYIYIPLHIFPENDVYANTGANNELYYIIKISKILPIDWKIVVKPSPLMFLTGCDVHPLSFYEKINKINNCYLVSPNENSNYLLKNSKATASISGTNLVEAVIMNKPAFRFGDFNLDSLDGIYKFDEKNFKKQLDQGNQNFKKNNYSLFQSIYENSFEMSYDQYCFGYEKKFKDNFQKTFLEPLEKNFINFIKKN